MKRGRKPDAYLIDACWKGNTLRVYFGSSVEEIGGDDFDDVPYESNVGIVYPEFVKCVLDVTIPFGYTICDPASELGCENSTLCRDDFKSGDIPLFWITDDTMSDRNDLVFRMGDKEKTVVEKFRLITTMMKFNRKE